jgi:Ran GTPase-activating protein (RanGAP) involved in mRNA processing and transport
VNLTGLETLLLRDTSKITELDIPYLPMMGFQRVLQALRRRPTLTKLGLHGFRLGRDDARGLGMFLCNTPCLHSLLLGACTLGSAGLAELAPALYRNTSIKVLDMAYNQLGGMETARLMRDIIRRNKTMTTLDLSMNEFGETTGAVERISDGLGSNSTLLKIDLTTCGLRDGRLSILAQTLAVGTRRCRSYSRQ